jgi:Caspase domain
LGVDLISFFVDFPHRPSVGMFCSGNTLSWWTPPDEEAHRVASHSLALGCLRIALCFLDAQPTEYRHELLGRGAVLGRRGGTLLAFGPLGLAVKDATVFADSMKKAADGLYDDVRVTLALDQDATRDNIHKLVDKVAAEIHPRDTFILFAAAHGAAENGRFYLIPQDYQSGPPGTLAQRAIGQEDLQDWLANRIKATKAIILLDTCESGALIAGHAKSRTDTPASDAAVGRLHEATGRPVLTAAAAGQFAHEGIIGESGERHGVFTWAVLDALRKGDTNGDDLIELSELVSHVQTVVPKVAAEMGGRGRAAASAPVWGKQAARFGSRGDDFAVARRLQ